MRVALFGGAFDPPHRGHLLVAQNILSAGLADEIWFVPCGDHPFGKELTPSKHRLAMVKSMLKNKMHADGYEIKHKGRSYSYRTLKYFSREYPHDEFCWIIGSDQLTDFHRWYKHRELLSEFRVYVYPRSGHPLLQRFVGMKLLPDMPVQTVSSTEIRLFFNQNLPVTKLLSPEVLRYIKANGLYNCT